MLANLIQHLTWFTAESRRKGLVSDLSPRSLHVQFRHGSKQCSPSRKFLSARVFCECARMWACVCVCMCVCMCGVFLSCVCACVCVCGVIFVVCVCVASICCGSVFVSFHTCVKSSPDCVERENDARPQQTPAMQNYYEPISDRKTGQSNRNHTHS